MRVRAEVDTLRETGTSTASQAIFVTHMCVCVCVCPRRDNNQSNLMTFPHTAERALLSAEHCALKYQNPENHLQKVLQPELYAGTNGTTQKLCKMTVYKLLRFIPL